MKSPGKAPHPWVLEISLGTNSIANLRVHFAQQDIHDFPATSVIETSEQECAYPGFYTVRAPNSLISDRQKHGSLPLSRILQVWGYIRELNSFTSIALYLISRISNSCIHISRGARFGPGTPTNLLEMHSICRDFHPKLWICAYGHWWVFISYWRVHSFRQRKPYFHANQPKQ